MRGGGWEYLVFFLYFLVYFLLWLTCISFYIHCFISRIYSVFYFCYYSWYMPGIDIIIWLKTRNLFVWFLCDFSLFLTDRTVVCSIFRQESHAVTGSIPSLILFWFILIFSDFYEFISNLSWFFEYYVADATLPLCPPLPTATPCKSGKIFNLKYCYFQNYLHIFTKMQDLATYSRCSGKLLMRRIQPDYLDHMICNVATTNGLPPGNFNES